MCKRREIHGITDWIRQKHKGAATVILAITSPTDKSRLMAKTSWILPKYSTAYCSVFLLPGPTTWFHFSVAKGIRLLAFAPTPRRCPAEAIRRLEARELERYSPWICSTRTCYQGWLEEVEGTPMSKSYKMVVLLAMLDRGPYEWHQPMTPEEAEGFFR